MSPSSRRYKPGRAGRNFNGIKGKPIPDFFGKYVHQPVINPLLAGDEVLKKIGGHFVNTLREVDVAGRWGGDEFVVFSPETGAAGGHQLAKRLCKGIRGLRFPSIGQVSVSIGVAQAIENEDLSHLQGRTDTALYQAKERGRNGVVVVE